MSRRRLLIFGWSDNVHIKRWVSALAQRGYEIRVVSQGGEPLPNADTIILPRKGKFSYFRYASKAVAAARNFKPDLVHAHYAGGFGLWAAMTKIKPTVLSVWGSDVVDLPRNLLFRTIIRRALKRADHVTVTGDYLKTLALGLEPSIADKITRIPFGVEIPVSPLALPESPPVRLCYLKAHRSIYGPEILIKAMTIVRQSLPDIKLNLAGRGEITAQLEQMISALNLLDCVKLVGHIDHNRIGEFISAHHIMVMPSLKEAFGVAALEAAAYARPVIASRVGGVEEVVVDGQTGLLVEAANVEQLAQTIIQLASSRDLMTQMGQNAYRRTKEKFDWQDSVDQMTALYERLLNQKA